MDVLSEIEKAKRKKILNEISVVYNSRNMSGLEDWARDYEGDYRGFVERVVGNLLMRNSNITSRIFSIDEFLIEELMAL